MAGEDDLRTLTVVPPTGETFTGPLTLSCEGACAKVRVYENGDRSNALSLPLSWELPSPPELPKTMYVEGHEKSGALRDVTLKLRHEGAGGPCEDIVNLTVVQVDLDIYSGGSDLDNGEAVGSQGALVPEDDEESVGAYILVNWDDDDGDGVMYADGTWALEPQPDLYEASVANEDNLARLVVSVDPVPTQGSIELTATAGADKLRAWWSREKAAELLLPRTWDLGDPLQWVSLQQAARDGLWIEGMQASDVVRDVQLQLRYTPPNTGAPHSDKVSATVVMINLANAVYRENAFPDFGADRGHAALVSRFVGPLTRDNLNSDDKFLIIEMDGPTDNRTLTTMTDFTDEWGVHYNAWGSFTNPSITFVQRLKILQAAKALVARAPGIAWCPYNVLLPENWPGGLHTITHLRCDGLVELCYEINGVDVWGMAGRPPDGGVHYDITDPSDNWDYNPTTGGWDDVSNQEFDNLEEHNDYDGGGAPWWSDTLVPATQCGHVIPENGDTKFRGNDLCTPVGSKGGNQ